ncbi:MAG: DUF4105 domain-containing protein [Barnesiella sp.]|nr:DUF4105 domain-containing protein [Barnesiella sp.]
MKNYFTLLFIFFCITLHAEPTDSVRVEFITCSPGSEIYELEGHAGLRVYTPGGVDVIYNWGLFDFNSDNFAYRFVKGETDYMVGGIPTEAFVRYYASEGRSVRAFELNLTPEEKGRLIDAININLLPQNRVYRYNYVKDNCSTRPLSLIEQAVGDTMRVTLPEGCEISSFRDAMRHYHANYPWYQMGVDIALGSGIDHPETPRAMLFAPDLAEKMLGDATIAGRPVVSRSYYLTGNELSNAVEPATAWYLSPLFWSIILLLSAGAISFWDIRRGTVSRWFDTLFYGAIFVASLPVCFLIFISTHEATSPNWQLLLFNPLTIIGVAGIWIKRAQSLVFCWQIVNFVALILLLILWGCGAQQFNTAIILLTITDLLRSSTYIIIKCRQKRNDQY